MHGVKRLFAWMIPRFDPEQFDVSLVSLRKKDLSEETLESMGVDISYLHKSKFDPATLTALLKVIDRQHTDILHLHGYGATTFGRLAGWMRGIPTILHEHANLTDTPWFQKVADKVLAPATDIAIAVSKSTAGFVVGPRQMPTERVKVVYFPGTHRVESYWFAFPREDAEGMPYLREGTQEVRFYCQLGPVAMRARFEPAKMVAHDGPDL